MTELSRLWRAFWTQPPPDRARLLRSALQSVRTEGTSATLRRLRRGARRLESRVADDDHYAAWCRRHTPTRDQLAKMTAVAAGFSKQPLISVLTPVYNTDPRWLDACAASVVSQVYTNWEWHVVDDGSRSPATLEALDRVSQLDARITVHQRPGNAGVSAATNVGLHAASGDYVALLDHDDALLPHALYRIVEHLNGVDVEPDVIYTDEDKLEPDGSRSDAYFKPDWSPDHFLSNMYACHLLVARRSLVLDVGAFRPAFDFAQDYDLVLRLMERANRIDHVADVVYHWRKVPQSTAGSGEAKPSAHAAGRRALEDYLARNRISGRVADAGPPGFYRVVFDLPRTPTVTVVGRRTQPECDRLLSLTAYRPLAFAPTVADASGDVLVMLDPMCEPQSPDWMEALLQVLLRPGVGAVGPKVLQADDTLEHIGLVLGLTGVAGRPLWGMSAHDPGYFGNALLVRTVSAVGGACLATTRDTFRRTGGIDEALGREASAIDYCLRVREAGERVVFTPWSVVRRGGQGPTPALGPDDDARLRARWGEALARDPYYNPNLTRGRLDYRVGD